MCEIAVTQNVVALKTANKLDSLVAARRFFPQMEREIHMARAFGPLLTTTQLQFALPDFDSAGLPVAGADGWSTRVCTYQVIADDSRPGQSKLVRSLAGGDTTVLLTGLVGPLNSNDPVVPQIFKYYQRGNATPISSPPLVLTGSDVAQVVGVKVTAEVAGNESARSELNSRSFAFSSDLFARSNLSAP